MYKSRALGVLMLMHLLWDMAWGFAIEIAALFFLLLSVASFLSQDTRAAAEALFAAALLWALREIGKSLKLSLRLKEFEIDKPSESVLLLMRDREPDWRTEYLALKKKAGLPDWWGPA
jgi:hypothetical protein